MSKKYGSYLTGFLLSEWQINPTEALGRSVSSPWPDRIEISSISKQDENTYVVQGNVIEITSNDDDKPFDLYPVTLTVVKYNNPWLTDKTTKGDLEKVSHNNISN